MSEQLKWISARQLIGEFIEWAEKNKGESFSHAIFKRAKLSKAEDLTDRQNLLVEFAEEFATIQQQKRSELVQMSPA